MNNLINLYPNTNFSEVNLDYIITLVRQNAGLHLELSGNQLLLKTLDGTTVSAVTVAFATEAGHAQTATNATNATYATTANSATNATNATNASHALTADSATTAGSATTATSATTAGTATEAVHAVNADTATNATNATHASEADYATTTGNVEKAGNGVKTFLGSDSGIMMTLEDNTMLTAPILKADKAVKDNLGNTINIHYVADVVEDNGTLLFKNASGSTIASITISSQTATEDSYGNTIADFIKAITAPSDSNYVTVTHGTGTAETLQVNYSNKAWKDTNGNVIKNFYIGSLEIVQDDDTGHYCLVCYNGDTPKAELFRTEINSYSAQIAEEATHAVDADNASYASEAQTASNALEADTCKDTNIYIQVHKNADGNYTPSSPNTLTIESIKNSVGETLTLSDLEMDNLSNVILKYHESSNDPYFRFYPASKIGQHDSSNPIFMDFDECQVSYDSTLGKNTIDSFHADLIYKNGSLLSSACYVSTDSYESQIVEVEIKSTDTAPLNLTVGQDSDYETDMDSTDIFNLLSKGIIVSLKFVDDDDNWQNTAIVNGSGSPAVIMLYATGSGACWFKLGNNSTYTTGLNIERLS